MKKTALILALLFGTTAYTQSVSAFRWLEGTWRMQEKVDTVKEHWTWQNDSLMTAVGFLLQGKDTLVIENVSLKAENGAVYYMPLLDGQGDDKPIRFKLTSTTDNTFVFENVSGEFPQRMVYRKASDTEIKAWIEGDDSGEHKKYEYSFRKE